MRKKLTISLLLLMGLLLFSSCAENKIGRIFISDDIQADARVEQIISAIKDTDKNALKSLFSKKALDEAVGFDNDVDYLFELLQDEIESWKRDGCSSDESTRYGKRTLMIRFAIDVNTDKDVYRFFVIDYATDTIDPDNQGVYMLEVRLADSPNTGSWQERMRAGLYIH